MKSYLTVVLYVTSAILYVSVIFAGFTHRTVLGIVLFILGTIAMTASSFLTLSLQRDEERKARKNKNKTEKSK